MNDSSSTPTVMNRTLIALALTAFVTLAEAGIVTHTVDTTGKPTFNRPVENLSTLAGSGSTAIPYDSYRFTVDTAGLYTFQTAGVYDTFTFLYSPSFAAGAPLANAKVGNDDLMGLIGTSGFTYSLATGVDYYFVTTGFLNTSAGLARTTIGGPGTIAPSTAEVAVAGDPRLVTTSGSTTGKPTFERPLEDLSGTSGESTAYSTYRFKVGASGTYQFLTTGGYDTFDVLYGAFDPTRPLANAIAASDDGYLATIGTSSFFADLVAGTTYTLVTTGYDAESFGSFVNTIVGPGAIIAAVEEPASVALAFAGLAGLCFAERRRRRTRIGTVAAA